LLAYLVASGKPQRRSRLCALLWDSPDDPRGALRSALSRIRALVDEPDHTRIVTEGSTVRFDCSSVVVDIVEARRPLTSDDGPASIPALEAAVASFRGEFAEDLSLHNSPDFHAWCTAEREDARRLHVRLLGQLIERQDADPEAALRHARTLAQIDSDMVIAHRTLLRLLVATGRQREAEEQLDISLRALAGAGGGEAATRELRFAWRELTGKAAATEPTQNATQVRDAPAPTPPVADATAKPCILVLPFFHAENDPEQASFSDGITEDIITDLSRLSAISVVARNAAFALKGKSVEVAQLTERLNVDYVIEGRLRKARDRIRITVQLVDVRTSTALWAERFDRDFQDIFALQDEISRNVVSALKLSVLPSELEAMVVHPTLNVQAYRHYLEARAKLAISWSHSDHLRNAREQFAAAVKLDPGYARAYAGLADCDAFLWVAGDLDVALEDMLANSCKALELAPNLAEAHASKGMALYIAGQPEAALSALGRALELDPELFDAHFFYALCAKDAGQLDEAAVHYERAAALQPRNHRPLGLLAELYAAQGRQQQSIATARRCLQRIERAFGREPEVAEVLGMGAAILVMVGENECADRWARRAVLLDPGSYTVWYNAACTHAVIGRPERAMECLDYIFAHVPRARRWLLRAIAHDTQFDMLRPRSDFQDLTARLERHAGPRPGADPSPR
jgi:TolB-like protein/DNA-binding SARP family transcriptional activator